MNFKRIAAGVITGTMGSLLLASSAFAATDVTINDNGNNSTNTAVVTNTSNCNVIQGNIAVVGTLAKSKARTGRNSANGNTGTGTVTVKSGKATSTTTVSTTTGNNTISSQSCCGCTDPLTTVEIKKNGNGSSNSAVVTNSDTKNVVQFNGALVLTGAFSSASTGGNTANGNTGSGSVDVTSGNAEATTSVDTTTGSNSM